MLATNWRGTAEFRALHTAQREVGANVLGTPVTRPAPGRPPSAGTRPLSALESPFVTEMLSWLNARFAPPGVTIRADTPLFKDRLIDSIRILELIAWTERAIGHEIPDRDIRTDNFASAARIAELFARGGGDARR